MMVRTLAGNHFCDPNPDVAQKSKQILLVPGTGGATQFDAVIKNRFCWLGYRTAVVDTDIDYHNFDTDYGVHDRYVNKFLDTLKGVLAESPKPSVIIGTSIGGMFASIGYSKNNEILNGLLQGAVLVSAGGPMIDVVERSQLEQLQRLRAQRFDFYAYFSEAEQNKMFKDSVSLDPVEMADPHKNKSVLMYISLNDEIMPTDLQETLWKAWGKPDVHYVRFGHISSIAIVLFTRFSEISRFIESL